MATTGLITIQVGIGMIMKIAQTSGSYSFSPSASITISEFLKLILSTFFFWRDIERKKDSGALSRSLPPTTEARGQYSPLVADDSAPSAEDPIGGQATTDIDITRIQSAASDTSRASVARESNLDIFWQELCVDVARQKIRGIYILALCYTVINNSIFLSYKIADPGTIQLSKSGGTVATALIMTSFLRTRISRGQWVAIGIQLVGMILTQYKSDSESRTAYPMGVYLILGFQLVLSASSSVYNQYLLKLDDCSLHVNNMILYAAGTSINLVCHLLIRSVNAGEPGFFHGYNNIGAVLVVMSNVFIGLAITVVYKSILVILVTIPQQAMPELEKSPVKVKPDLIVSPFRNTFAMVRWNQPRPERIPLIRKYDSFFHTVHISGAQIALKEYSPTRRDWDSDQSNSTFTIYTEVARNMEMILLNNPLIDGLLYFHFDAWLDPMAWADMDRNQIWFPQSFEPPPICTNDTKTVGWWGWDRKAHLPILEANKAVDDLGLRYKVRKDEFCLGWSDIYYIPRRFFTDFIVLANVYGKHDAFHELATPTMVRIINETYSQGTDKPAVYDVHDCWGSCCSEHPTIDDVTRTRCGHKLDYLSQPLRDAFFGKLESQARMIGLPTSTWARSTVAAVADAAERPAPLQVDTEAYGNGDGDGDGDGDSAYGSDGGSAYTGSVTSSIYDYQYENGRRYHAYREGQYVLPNDDQEQERLDLQHHIWRLLLGGRLYTAQLPPPSTNPNLRILDLGTGTGIWAIDMADEFPSAEVAGVDLSPIQPEWVPNNCRFHVDDYEDEWTYRDDEKFDYIHGRALSGTSADWDRFYKQALRNLKPGAVMEMQEYDAWIFSDDDSCDRAPWTMEWVNKLDDASKMYGKQINVARHHKQWMKDAGFEDVREVIHRIPIGPWAKDPALKELGRFELIHMQMSVDSHTPALFTRVLNYSSDQAMVLMEGVKREFRSRDLRLITSYRFVTGRKPADVA
ncbi:cmp-sialic acid transporter [Purpureocillium lavendulum]|uniref:Cmp-sialic acid transporter n=1 Tax=Purpureocillium lavendulum TaxID=1247861 RepID=A0AB34FMB3_9HYPO|nr:cmp-sialic acid transporter [Purpureocillium lavendulum]